MALSSTDVVIIVIASLVFVGLLALLMIRHRMRGQLMEKRLLDEENTGARFTDLSDITVQTSK